MDTGLQTFTWTYEKDYYWDEGQDCAWIDYIVFPVNSFCTGVAPVETSDFSFQIFPNPASGSVIVRFNDRLPSDGMLTVLGADGRQIQQVGLHPYISEQSIQIGHLTRGIYFIVIETGQQNYVRKVIKL